MKTKRKRGTEDKCEDNSASGYKKRMWKFKSSETKINEELGTAHRACLERDLDQKSGHPAPELLLHLDRMAAKICESQSSLRQSEDVSPDAPIDEKQLFHSIPESSLVALGVVVEEFILGELKKHEELS